MAVPAAPPRRRKSAMSVILIVASVLLVAFVGLPVIFCAVIGSKAPRIEEGTVLSLRLDGEIPEGPTSNPFEMIARADGPLSLHEMRQLAEAVKDDDRVAGVLLQIGPLAANMGTLEEIREIVGRIRENGKPVHALLVGDFVEEDAYYLATAADRIVVSPQSGLLLNGYVGEVTFWRGSLEKIHVKPQFIMFKEYKSAAEPFSRYEMSPAFEEWLTAVLTEYHARFVDTVAERRQIDAQTLIDLVNTGGMTSKQALAAKLVDALGYYDEVEEALRTGAAPDVEEPHVMTGQRYLGARRDFAPGGEKIAVIYASGPITSAHGSQGLFGGTGIAGPDMARTIREAADDESIKAIVMRVDSPGGSAVGSDFIRREVQRAKAKKPFVVSMGGVAASGGYWISMDADSIVAQPSTLTGSIGVVFGKFDTEGFWKWIGANVDKVQVGENADLMSMTSSLDESQLKTVTAWMTDVYTSFVQGVADGRGMTYEEAEPLAHGRVWTGAQAKERKLVDELGGLYAAVDLAREKAGLAGKKTQLVVYPREKPFFEALAEALSGAQAAATRKAELESVLREVDRELSTPRVLLLSPEIEVH